MNLPAKTKTVLLVEDDPNDIELTVMTLSEHNLTNKVDVANNGAEALDYLYCRGKYAGREGGNPVVVLLDLKMPKVDGLEFLQMLRADGNFRHLPVVVLTSSHESPDIKRCYEYGVNAYVVKPVNFPALVDAVKCLGIFWVMINEPPPA